METARKLLQDRIHRRKHKIRYFDNWSKLKKEKEEKEKVEH
jgi:hypothetical protein